MKNTNQISVCFCSFMLLFGTNAEYQFSGNTFKIPGSGNDAVCGIGAG